MAVYPFLSDEWIAEARKIREESGADAPSPATEIRMNLVVTDVPFGDGPVAAHVEAGPNGIELDLGHLDSAHLKVTVDYDTAKSILVDGNPQAGMQAFMTGKIKVEGDMAKLMALQAAPPDPSAQAVAQRLKEITA